MKRKFFEEDQAHRLPGAIVESSQTDAMNAWEEITLRLKDGAVVTVRGLWFNTGDAGLALDEVVEP